MPHRASLVQRVKCLLEENFVGHVVEGLSQTLRIPRVLLVHWAKWRRVTMTTAHNVRQEKHQTLQEPAVLVVLQDRFLLMERSVNLARLAPNQITLRTQQFARFVPKVKFHQAVLSVGLADQDLSPELQILLAIHVQMGNSPAGIVTTALPVQQVKNQTRITPIVRCVLLDQCPRLEITVNLALLELNPTTQPILPLALSVPPVKFPLGVSSVAYVPPVQSQMR